MNSYVPICIMVRMKGSKRYFPFVFNEHLTLKSLLHRLTRYNRSRIVLLYGVDERGNPVYISTDESLLYALHHCRSSINDPLKLVAHECHDHRRTLSVGDLTDDSTESSEASESQVDQTSSICSSFRSYDDQSQQGLEELESTEKSDSARKPPHSNQKPNANEIKADIRRLIFQYKLRHGLPAPLLFHQQLGGQNISHNVDKSKREKHVKRHSTSNPQAHFPANNLKRSSVPMLRGRANSISQPPLLSFAQLNGSHGHQKLVGRNSESSISQDQTTKIHSTKEDPA